VGRLINLDHADILRYYNSKIHGILSAYEFVSNRKSLGTVVHLLKHSCALTLALKYKLRTKAKVFRKFGPTLMDKKTNIKLFIPKTFAKIGFTKFNKVDVPCLTQKILER